MAWQYQDLIDEFYEDVERYKKDYYSHDEAINMTFNELYSESIVDEMEKALIFIVYAELSLQNPRIFKKTKEILIQELESINLERIKGQIKDGQLTQVQFGELSSRKDKALQEIKRMPIDLCGQARWYYIELTNAVRDFCTELTADSVNGDEITEKVLCRYKRSCDRTLSTKITVFVTLADILAENSHIVPKEILNKIMIFKVNSIDTEFDFDEKADLLKRIQNLMVR